MSFVRIGVECSFTENGTVRVRRIKLGQNWVSVGQGRQWQDGNGRHVLIMLPNQQVREIVQRPDTLIWEMVTSGQTGSRLA
ncbi:MAG: hypothetical protein KC421_28745 [Anaerolineales bacterium]|nr:hypothetical protein [Anaerolineales bacterium]